MLDIIAVTKLMCSDCYEEDEDTDAPNDPQIFDSQRNEIISLAKDWLNGKRPKRLIKINPNDYLTTGNSSRGWFG